MCENLSYVFDEPTDAWLDSLGFISDVELVELENEANLSVEAQALEKEIEALGMFAGDEKTFIAWITCKIRLAEVTEELRAIGSAI